MLENITGLEQSLLKGLFVIYLIGMVMYLLYAITGARPIRSIATGIAVLGILGSLADLALRGMASGRMPTATLFEYSLLMIAAGIITFLVIDWLSLRRGADLALVGAFMMGFCFVLLMFLFFKLGVGHKTAETIPPILKSSWRTIHIVGGAISYGGIVLAFAFASLFLLRPWLTKEGKSETSGSGLLASRIPSADVLDRLCYLSVAYSFPFLTLLNVTGAIWAVQSWNRYWQWDPKEVWGLITWLVYAIYLHARLRSEWRGKRIAWIAVIGFGAMAFTFLGVNFLSAFQGSLHSYASGK